MKQQHFIRSHKRIKNEWIKGIEIKSWERQKNELKALNCLKASKAIAQFILMPLKETEESDEGELCFGDEVI